MAATIRDVANLSGYSVGTISKYINGQPVKEATKIAIDYAIQQLNYSPNNIAKGLRNSKSFSIAILLPMLNSTFCTSMISSIESCLLPEGYSVIVCECHNDAKMELQKTQFLIDRMVDGIILIPYASDGKQIKMIQEHNIPLVVLDQKIEGVEADTIILDNMTASYEPTKHLIELGHKDIAIITGTSNHYTSRERFAGYEKAMKEYHLPIRPEFIQCGNYSTEGGYDAMLRLFDLPHKPSAVFISNYDMTVGAYLAINYLKLKIPNEISIIGFDNFPLANVVNPPLSFAEQPIDAMGLAAGKLLYKRIKGDYSDYPQTIVHNPTIYYKESICSL